MIVQKNDGYPSSDGRRKLIISEMIISINKTNIGIAARDRWVMEK